MHPTFKAIKKAGLIGVIFLQAGLVTTAHASLKVATWNVEHLAYPSDTGCNPRTEAQIAQLREYADSLEADIIGLQEVASKKAAHQLFPESDWQIIMSPRKDSEPFECRESGFTSTQQKVAFAIRKNLSVNESRGISEFGLDRPGLRYGLEIEVTTPQASITLLNLHMKSGCFVDNYTRRDSDACLTFAKQAPLLDEWIDEQEATNQPYIIMGDFNHRLTAPYNHLTRQIMRDDNGNRNSLISTHAETIGCHPYYPAPIDLVFAGNMPAQSWVFEPSVAKYDDMDPDAMLADHCAVMTEFTLKR